MLNRYLRFAGAGVQFALIMTIFTLGGIWLDGRLDWSPVFTIVGALLGMGLAMYVLIVNVLRAKS